MFGTQKQSNGGTVQDDVISSLVESAYGAKLERIRQEAFAEAERDNEIRLAEIRQREKARYEEQLAGYMDDVEQDIEARTAQQATQARAQLQRQYAEQLEALDAQLADASALLAESDAAVRELVKALLPAPEKAYALGRHCVVRTFPLADTNAVLARYNAMIEALQGGSACRIECDGASYTALVRHEGSRD